MRNQNLEEHWIGAVCHHATQLYRDKASMDHGGSSSHEQLGLTEHETKEASYVVVSVPSPTLAHPRKITSTVPGDKGRCHGCTAEASCPAAVISGSVEAMISYRLHVKMTKDSHQIHR